MKLATLTSTAAILASWQRWESIDYPDETGKYLLFYPRHQKGGKTVHYPEDAGAGAVSSKSSSCASPFLFTSTYNIVAIGSEVKNATTPAREPEKAFDSSNFCINSKTDSNYFASPSPSPPVSEISSKFFQNIILLNVAGAYQSPASTATHIHEAAREASGPPHLTFPNPVGNDHERIGVGCLAGPLKTGLNSADGKGTGTGFSVKRIEENRARFFSEFHTDMFPLGVVRGQVVEWRKIEAS